MMLCNSEIVLALDCPPFPEQVSKDWQVEVEGAVGKIGRVSGAELKGRTRNATQDLLGKFPDAGRVYLEQMMLSSYCSSLRDDKKLSDTEKSKKLKEYLEEVRRTMGQTPSPKAPPPKQSNKKAPISTPSVAQSPPTSLHSEGANSPNIVGNGNTVIIAPSPDALAEIRDLLRQRGYPDDPQKLMRKYPLGYAIFEFDHMNQVIPYEALSLLKNYDVDWSVVKVIQNTNDKIALRLPDLKRKDGTVGITNVQTGGTKRVGLLGCGMIGNESESLGFCGEILALRENGPLFLVSLQQFPKLSRQ